MATIKIKRGLESNRLSYTPLEGELIYITDTKTVYSGDGVTAGGNPVLLTATQILELVKFLDGTSSGLNLDTIHGLEGAQFVRTDIDNTMNGLLTLEDNSLSAIDKIANANAVVDVFVYDTTKDSDGGQWRKRCSKLSWYNEPLNTATRGSTKEFPSVALIVAELDKVTIYDATKSDCPMWMVFDETASNGILTWAGGASITNININIKNGILIVGLDSGPTGGVMCNFNTDSFKSIYGASFTFSNYPNIKDRTSGTSFIVGTPDYFIVNGIINDIAMTVLDNAPIDTETGLPVPTIAVATNGGVSIIHNDGNVVDITGIAYINNISNYISFTKDHKLVFGTREGQLEKNIYLVNYGNIPSTDDADPLTNFYTVDETYGNDYPNSGLSILSNGTQISSLVTDKGVGTLAALNLISNTYDFDNVSLNMVNYITNSFQSGWMRGDIKGAFLANSKTADRSINNNPLVETGSVTENPVRPGAELMTYSGFSSSNYLEQPYNSDLDFGTGDFYVMGWINSFDNYGMILDKGVGVSDGLKIGTHTGVDTTLGVRLGSAAWLPSTSPIPIDIWSFIVIRRKAGILDMFINSDNVGSYSDSTNIDVTNAKLRIGSRNGDGAHSISGTLSLWRIGAGAPTDEQIKEIYESEHHLFKENTDCTLSSSTSAVNALAYDETTNLLHVAGSDNLDTFDGLVRTNSEVGAYTSLSAVDGIIAKGN